MTTLGDASDTAPRDARRRTVVVASHNLMRGKRLDALAAYHRALRASTGLDVLCVQEARRDADGTTHAVKLARAMGDWADVIATDPVHGVAIVFDRTRLSLVRHESFALPFAERMNLFERRVLLDDRPVQIEAMLAVFQPAGADTFAVVAFHLDTIGGTRHRRAQVEAIARRLAAERVERVVVTGDTNAFDIGRARQRATLETVLEPLAALGLRDAGDGETHWFARQEEPGMVHLVVRTLARLGLEFPGRYDVLCTDLPALTHGRVQTLESDHDLIWAELAID